MNVRNVTALYIGIGLFLLFFFSYVLKKKKLDRTCDGRRFGNLALLYENPIYKRKKIIYYILTWIGVIGMSVSLIAVGVLMARPFSTETVKEEQYSRDIIICLDASSSVDEVNVGLCSELKESVTKLRGERVGIIIFNTSAVMIAPLTDDYDYILEQLDTIEKALRIRIKLDKTGKINSDDYKLLEFIQGGTLVGNSERGSSLIGDGLASCVANFSNDDSKRARVVIFATDNDPYGESYFELPDAARYCADHNITVYGVGTGDMSGTRINEMKDAVERTGGKFYQQRVSGTFEEIVHEIEKLSADKIEGRSYVKETDVPQKAFIVMVFGIIMCMASLRVLKI